eukprot:GGOE01019083.1.p1 GENE.GGOE01019083.1~~GGOE01019083.1.p1  ORF type:complete len:663 (+),score=124.73 GGOE01019083.1:100-1989(+)
MCSAFLSSIAATRIMLIPMSPSLPHHRCASSHVLNEWLFPLTDHSVAGMATLVSEPERVLMMPLLVLAINPQHERPSLFQQSKKCIGAVPALLLGCLSTLALLHNAVTTATMSYAVPSALHQPLRLTAGPIVVPFVAPLPARRSNYGEVNRHGTWKGHQRIVRPPPTDDDDDDWGLEEDMGEPLPSTIIRPDLKTLVDPNIDPKVVAAVDRLGGKVTVADVATASGVSLAAATAAVRDMAYLTGAGVLVTDQGELLYTFGPAVKAQLAARSLRAMASQAYERASPALGKLGRVTFGVVLFASLAIIFTSITMLQASSQDRDDRDSRKGRKGSAGSFAPHIQWGPDIWVVPEPYYSHGPKKRGMSFIESIYSFVFGDGDPNFNLEERRYRQIAQLIRDSGGVVTAEQLAPYLDPPRRWLEREKTNLVDEAFVAPALTRFNGRAEVTAAGDIVYVFDELQPTIARPSSSLPRLPALLEKEEKFSRASSLNLSLAAGLGLLNLVGVFHLGSLFSSVATHRALGPFLDGVRTAYPFLALYATVFLGAPLWRWLRLQMKNKQITRRNAVRAEAATELDHPSPSLLKKLRSTKQYHLSEQRIQRRSIIYNSENNEPARGVDQFADFDHRLKGFRR